MGDILKPGFSDSATGIIQTFKLLSWFKCKEILLKVTNIQIIPLLVAQTEMVRVCKIVNQDQWSAILEKTVSFGLPNGKCQRILKEDVIMGMPRQGLYRSCPLMSSPIAILCH